MMIKSYSFMAHRVWDMCEMRDSLNDDKILLYRVWGMCGTRVSLNDDKILLFYGI
jgi:hypothetical protein